jgi:hypothetical protein
MKPEPHSRSKPNRHTESVKPAIADFDDGLYLGKYYLIEGFKLLTATKPLHIPLFRKINEISLESSA